MSSPDGFQPDAASLAFAALTGYTIQYQFTVSVYNVEQFFSGKFGALPPAGYSRWVQVQLDSSSIPFTKADIVDALVKDKKVTKLSFGSNASAYATIRILGSDGSTMIINRDDFPV